MFVAIELVIRRFFRVEKAHEMASSEGKITSSVLSNDDVLFYWCMASCDVPDKLAKEILAKQWITIRGFSFAKSFMEIYKQHAKKHLQRSKAFSEKLFSENT